MDNEFERFMINVLDHAPGHCSEVFRKFVGTADREIEFVGMFENLVDDLVAGLRLAGAQFDEAGLRKTAIRNASDYSAFSTKCSPEIRDRVLNAECELFERFNYSTDTSMLENTFPNPLLARLIPAIRDLSPGRSRVLKPPRVESDRRR